MSNENSRQVDVKLYLNGFPKSGTHILAVMASRILKRAIADKNWLGNLGGAFTTNTENTEKVLEVLNVFTPNVYIKGHMAYTPELAKSFVNNRIVKALIFRDMRDVAVSTAYHALCEEDGTIFPEKDYYQELGFEETLKRVITGDKNVDSVMARWETFAPWLEEDWVLKLTFEDYIEHPKEVSKLFLRYVYWKAAKCAGLSIELDEDDLDILIRGLMTGHDEAPNISPTYREGKIGKWKEHFTDEHKELFKESDKNDWLIRLGYADDRDW